MTTYIKYCGFTRLADVEVALSLNIDYLGFVFYPHSPRFISPDKANDLIKCIHQHHNTAKIKAVGLFVNHTESEIIDAVHNSNIDIMQFHGDVTLETPELCKKLSLTLDKPYWKVIHIQAPQQQSDNKSINNIDINAIYNQCLAYQNAGASALLFDTQCAALNVWGGTGQTFDWSILTKLHTLIKIPIILSGGLTINNITDAINTVKPFAVDVSSGIEAMDNITGERRKGIKDTSLMHQFVALCNTH